MGSQSHYRGVVEFGKTINTDTGVPGSFVIKPKALDIIWGADSRYWRLPQSETDPAELLQVSWLEVNGSLDLEKMQAKSYNLTFKVSMQPDAFGWKGSPVYLMAKVGANKHIWKSRDLSKPAQDIFEIPSDFKFTVTEADIAKKDKFRFGIYEIWRGRWKGGLVIHEVQIVPVN